MPAAALVLAADSGYMPPAGSFEPAGSSSALPLETSPRLMGCKPAAGAVS